MSVGTFAGDMPEDWFCRCEFENFRYFDVGLVPFEDEEATRLQYSETFCKSLGQQITPIRFKISVFYFLPSRTIDFQVRRVEHDHCKAVVRVRHIGKVCLHIGFNLKVSPIAEGCFHVSDVLEQYTRVVFVEIEHLAATTGIEYWFVAKRQMRRCFCPLTY